MKKILSLILSALILTAMLASCGTGKDGDETTSPTTTAKPETTKAPDETTKEPDETTSGKPDDTTEVPGGALDGTLEEIFAAIYKIRPIKISLISTEVDLGNADRVKFCTGLDSAENIEECLVSDAMISASAYSAVLIRVKDGADIDQMKKDILNGVDLRRWVCVGADKVVVGNSDNVIFMAMTVDAMVDAADLFAAFAEVAGGNTGEMLERTANP